MKTKIIAEIGINHNGSLDLAKELIDHAAHCGCDFVKFQKRTVEDVYTKEELDKYRESPWGTTNREQKMRLEFSEEEYDELDSYCKEKKIEWFASPWDVKSVDFLMKYNPKYIKVASAMMTNVPMLKKLANVTEGTDTRLIVSTGMTTIDELDACLEIIGEHTDYILSCTSSYPTPVDEMNMSRILTLRRIYGDGYKIGFSNHSPGILFILQAFILGCEMIEYHITIDRAMYGSDQGASIEPEGMYRLSKYLRSLEKGLGTGEIGCQPSEVPIKKKLRV